MWKALLVFAVTLPVFAHADVWRWRDSSGQIHYSNVPGNVPKQASPVRADVGYLTAAPTHEPVAVAAVESSPTELRRSERRLRRRLAEIEAFYKQIRDRQRARLESYATSTLLPDWLVADRWMAAKDEETRLRAALAQLERRRNGLL
jgi:Domain of unknown function (DUF4124)